MIKLSKPGGSHTHVAAANIAPVTPAGPNGQGIRSYVRLFDGGSIECADDADEVAAMVDHELHQLQVG